MVREACAAGRNNKARTTQGSGPIWGCCLWKLQRYASGTDPRHMHMHMQQSDPDWHIVFIENSMTG